MEKIVTLDTVMKNCAKHEYNDRMQIVNRVVEKYLNVTVDSKGKTVAVGNCDGILCKQGD